MKCDKQDICPYKEIEQTKRCNLDIYKFCDYYELTQHEERETGIGAMVEADVWRLK